MTQPEIGDVAHDYLREYMENLAAVIRLLRKEPLSAQRFWLPSLPE